MTEELTLKDIRPDTMIRFGTDGWRGVIGNDFTFDRAKLVTHAVAQAFQTGKKQKVFIGYDHRFLAEEFARKVARVLNAYAFEAQVLPIAVSSPLLSFVTKKNKAPFGIMLTASHNPPEYLGYKVKGGFGGSIAPEEVTQIEEKLDKIFAGAATNPVAATEKTAFAPNPLPNYIEYLMKRLDLSLWKKARGTIIIDAMYGPGAPIVEEFFKKLSHGLTVKVIHNKRDPLFGGLHPEPIETYLGELKETVKKEKALLGIALDGDADRLGLVDEKGTYLTPQQSFALLLYYLAGIKKLKGKVVQAVSLGYTSERMAKKWDLPFEQVPVGFKHVASRMIKEEVVLGGEESGGFAFARTQKSDKPGAILPERDGLLNGLMVLELTLALKKNVQDILKLIEKEFGASHYQRNDVPLIKPISDREKFLNTVQKKLPKKWGTYEVADIATIDGIKVFMNDGSWFLIRPSGTEPLLRTYAEFPAVKDSADALKNLYKILEPELRSRGVISA